MGHRKHILPLDLRRDFLLSLLRISLGAVGLILALMFILSPEFPILIFAPLLILQISGLYWLGKNQKINFIAHTFTLLTWLTVFLYAALAGGIQSPGFYFFILTPIFAFLTLQRRHVFLWMMITLLSIGSFFFFGEVLVFRAFQGNSWWQLIAPILLLGIIGLCLHFFNLFLLIKDKEIAEKNQVVKAQDSMLSTQESTIMEQMSKIKEQNDFLSEQQQEIEAINEQLESLLQESDRRNAKLEKYIESLLEASKSEMLHSGELGKSLEMLCTLVGDLLKVERVSIWRYQDVPAKINLLAMTIGGKSQVILPTELEKSNYPSYFESLEKEEMIVANDVYHHPATKELSHPYLVSNKICSMLDGPFFIDSRLSGVICCESLVRRDWKPEEIIFIKSVADIVSLAFKSKQRKDYEVLLKEQRDLVKRLNLELEKKIDDRTREIIKQNMQLLGYAHLNSHMVRGPICRILGLRNLLEMTNDPQEIIQLKELLLIAINELDTATKKAAEVLENGISKDLLQEDISKLVN